MQLLGWIFTHFVENIFYETCKNISTFSFDWVIKQKKHLFFEDGDELVMVKVTFVQILKHVYTQACLKFHAETDASEKLN